MKQQKCQQEAFRFACVYEHEDMTVALVAPTIQQLAAAWRKLADSKFNPSEVNEVRIEPE